MRPGCTACASSIAPTMARGAAASTNERPSMRTVPLVGRCSPRIMRMVVDLPAPLGPSRPVTRPVRAVKDRSSTASLSPYLLASPSTSIMLPPLRLDAASSVVSGQDTRLGDRLDDDRRCFPALPTATRQPRQASVGSVEGDSQGSSGRDPSVKLAAPELVSAATAICSQPQQPRSGRTAPAGGTRRDASPRTTPRTPHRLREQATHHPLDQPARSVQLGQDDRARPSSSVQPRQFLGVGAL